MPSIELPRPVRTALFLLLGLAGFGLLQALAGWLELRHVDGNLAEITARSTSLADAMRAAEQMRGSGSLALWVGGVGGLLILVTALFYRRAFTWVRLTVVLLCVAVFFGQVLLMLQDGAIGIQPYLDQSKDLVQQDLINSLIVLPGYFVMIYPAEAAGLVLPVMIIFRMFQEPAVEFFRLRKRVTDDRVWDVADILAKRQAQ